MEIEETAGNRNPVLYLFETLWRFAEGFRKNITAYWTCFIISNLIDMIVFPFLMAKIVRILSHERITAENIHILLWILVYRVIAIAVSWFFHGNGRVLECQTAFRAEASMVKHLLRGILGLSLDWHAARISGDTIDKINKGTDDLHEFSAQAFILIMYTVRLIVCLALLAYYHLVGGIIALGMFVIVLFIIKALDKPLIEKQKTLSEMNNSIAADIADSVGNITTIIILRIQNQIYKNLEKKIYEPFKLFVERRKGEEIKWFCVDLFGIMTSGLVLGTYFYQHFGMMIELAEYYLLIRYLDEMWDVSRQATNMYGQVIKQKIHVESADMLSRDFKTGSLTNHVLPENWQKIEVKNLNFKYQGSERKYSNLNNVSFTLRRGERIGIVGLSGSGKTTLLKVLRDLHHPQSLDLFVDGKRISEGFEGIGNAMALVPQQPEIFATTILRNITFGEQYSLKEVRHFTDLACFSEVVDRLPRQFDSRVNERGVNLSGGEKQRLALARALATCGGKSILMFDEPTSSVDPESQHKIFTGIMEEFKDTTILASTHQYDLLHLFDRIFVFDQGRIVAQGTLEEVRATYPKFQKLREDLERQQRLESATLSLQLS